MRSMEKRRGFSGADMTMGIVIIAILIALLLPAVQAAREAARRAQCTSQLRQLGIAIHNYHDVNNQFPAGVGVKEQSVLLPLLPFTEQHAAYEQITTAMNSSDSVNELDPETLQFRGFPLFTCPSDPAAKLPCVTSFHACSGDRVETFTDADRKNSKWEPRNAFVTTPDASKPYYCNIVRITDGTSNTVALAESRIATGAATPRVWQNTSIFTDWNATSEKAIPADCAQNLSDMPDSLANANHEWLGAKWYDARMTCTRFLTILPPNTTSCTQGDETNLPLITASSYHTNGANLGMFDASVRFVADSIDAGDASANATQAGGESKYGVWGALGTMNGGEAVFMP